jgi:hypothetical protein
MSVTQFRAGMRLAMATALVGTVVVVGPVPTASAAWLDSETPLTTDSNDKSQPEVSGARIAYLDYRNYNTVDDHGDPVGRVDVRVLNLGTASNSLITSGHDAISWETPAISGNRVVWRAFRSGRYRLWYRNLSGHHANVRLPVNGYNVQIDGTRLCYARSGRIWVYDLSKRREKAISAKGTVANCHIKGSVVVWESYSDANHLDIRAYNLKTKKLTKVTNRPGTQESPRTDGTWVIYDEDTTGDGTVYDLFAYNLKTHTETVVRSSVANGVHADVSGARVVWSDFAQTNLYDLGTGVTTAVSAARTEPRISGNRIVYAKEIAGVQQFFVRNVVPPTFTIGAPSSVPSGTTPQVGGTLSWGGSSVMGKVVRLEYSTNKKTWVVGASTLTNLDGQFTLTAPAITKTTWVRVRFVGDSSFAPAVSATRKITRT